MNRFQKLSSMVVLLLAFIYPPTLAEAKDTTLNHVFNEQSIDTQTTLLGEQSEELLLAHRRTQRRYHRQRQSGKYYQRHRNRKNYHRRRYRSIRYRGQAYRYGQWELVRDRHGRLMYDWRR
ncbi:hypothetical protein NIES2107_47380 [Nostoc carneum NIES-2107]|nr:hypothetical protein NIES2107_47380 [Nostoc carneum NIES-2107]